MMSEEKDCIFYTHNAPNPCRVDEANKARKENGNKCPEKCEHRTSNEEYTERSSPK